jgi:hypothetical protein
MDSDEILKELALANLHAVSILVSSKDYLEQLLS